MRNQEQEKDVRNLHLEHSLKSPATSSASMRTKAPRKVTGLKRSVNMAEGSSHSPQKTRRLMEGCKARADSSGQAAQDKVVGDKNAADDLRTGDVDEYHGSRDSHVQFREDRQHSCHRVFTLKWYDSLRAESIDKKRFMTPQNVLMPGYFVVKDHSHNSIFSRGPESQEADLLYQVLAFVQSISNELLSVLKATDEVGAKAWEENITHIWKKLRGVSEMLETRYDLLQFRRLGHSVQAKLLESYCVPQLGGSILARSIFRKLRNVCPHENAVASAENTQAKSVQNTRKDSELNAQLGDDRADDVNVVLHLQGKSGDKSADLNVGISNNAYDASNKENSEEYTLVLADDSRKLKYQGTKIQSNLLNVHDGLNKFPVQSKPLRSLTISDGSQVLVKHVKNDESDGDAGTPRRGKWKGLKVVAISDGIGQSASDMMTALPRSQLKTHEANSASKVGVERKCDNVNYAKHAVPLSPRKTSVLVNGPSGAAVPCVSTLLTLGKTIAFTCVLGEEQRRLYRHVVVCPSWGGFSWSLLIFPNGDRKENVLSVFLKCFGRENGERSVRWKADAKFGICVARRSSAIYASAVGGGRNARLLSRACNEVLEMLPSVDGSREPRRADGDYFGTAQHVFHSKCNNRGFPQLAPTSELRKPMFSNDEKKMVLFAFISEVQDVGQK